jgi:hypothetical protein
MIEPKKSASRKGSKDPGNVVADPMSEWRVMSGYTFEFA